MKTVIDLYYLAVHIKWVILYNRKSTLRYKHMFKMVDKYQSLKFTLFKEKPSKVKL